MKTKTIVFTEAYKAELIESELREPNENEVVVRLAVSSVSSGTERANFIGDPNVNCFVDNQEAVFPRILGYSSAGTVEKIGKSVTKVKVGDRVSVAKAVHSKFVVAHESNVHKIESEDISFNDAALWYISTFPSAAIRKCRFEFGESAIVMGMGILGIIAVKLLKAAGAVPVIAVDPSPEKREKALGFGADFAFDPFDDLFVQKVKEVTDGGVNVAIEVTGNGNALNQVLDSMKRFGRVALLGCTRDSDFTVDYYRKVHGPGITLVGAHTVARPFAESSPGWWTDADDIKAVQKLTKYGRLNLSDIVEEVHSPTEAQEVYTRLACEKSFPVVQFRWEDI